MTEEYKQSTRQNFVNVSYVRDDGSREIILTSEKTNEELFRCTVFPIQTSPEPFSNGNKELTDKLRSDREMIQDGRINSQSLTLEDIPDMNNSNKLQTGENGFSAEIRPNEGLYKNGLESTQKPIYNLMETLLCDPNKTQSYADIMLTPKIVYGAGIFIG